MLMKYRLRNVDCANCAMKIEKHLRSQSAVKDVSVDFATLTLHIDASDLELVRREIKKIEPDADIIIPSDSKAEKEISGFKFRKESLALSIAFILFLTELLFEKQLHKSPFSIAEYAVALTAYILAGRAILINAFKTIRKGLFFDENVLMTIATAGAFAIHAIPEAIGVMIFFKVGEILQNLAVSRSRRSIKALLEVRPDYANLKTADSIIRTLPEKVMPGDLIAVRAGEKVPLDGVVISGSSFINASALTGESLPLSIHAGDTVKAGEVNIDGLLIVRVTKPFTESSISKILALVENATAKKARTEQFISNFAIYYTPLVVFLAICTAILPPLFISEESFSTWIYRALVLLVISCPCALLVSVPLGYFGGIGGASRKGILVKGSNYLDILANVKTVVFDKTGTLTKGLFNVRKVITRNGYTSDEILSLAALAESHSNHPIAKSICAAAAKINKPCKDELTEHREIAGHGVFARTSDYAILAGNDALMHSHDIDHDDCETVGTAVHVSINGKYAGHILIGDEIREDAAYAIAELRNSGIKKIVMFTGDNSESAAIVSKNLGVDVFHADLLPQDKVSRLEELLNTQKGSDKVAFVGDGINDAPVIARADVGIAMGALGSDAAIETADVVLVNDHLPKIAEAVKIGRKTKNIIWQNIVFALGIKILFISFGAFGLAGMWEAVFADMGTALIAILNSARALKT